jgi:hypothetical protein
MPGAPRVFAIPRGRRYGQRAWLALCIGAFVAAFSTATVLGFLEPYTNWDMVAYVGSAISWTEDEPQVIYQRTLEDIKPVVWDWWYKDITEHTVFSKKAEHFVQHLPFYTTKPVYVGSVWLLRALNITDTYSAGTWVVSALCFIGLSVLLLLWRTEHMNRGAWLLMLVALCWLGNYPLASLARFSTPDAMSTLVLFAAIGALFQWKKPWLGVALLVLNVLVRPEMAIFAVMVAAMCMVMEKAYAPLDYMKSAALAGASTVVYVAVQKLAGAYGFKKLFYYSLVNPMPNPAEVEVHLTLKNYTDALTLGLKNIFADPRLVPLLVLSALAVVCYAMRPVASRVYPWLLLLAWGNFAIRFLIFPVWWDYHRYYWINYLLIILASGEMMSPYLQALWQKLLKHRAEIDAVESEPMKGSPPT